MSNTDQDMPTGKPARRNRKGERRQKAAPVQGAEADQTPNPESDLSLLSEPDQTEDAKAQIDAVAASPEVTTEPAIAAEPAPANAAVSLRTIASAYGDYTLKSLDEARSFLERLSGVRSLDKAMEVQREFARQACATFVAQTERISELHRELARQTLKPLDGFMTNATKAGR